MLELETSDASVNAASRRLQELRKQGLDRFSRSAAIGRAELATIVLRGLAELGAVADWTVGPSITNSVFHLLNDDERERYQKFQETVRRATEKAGPVEGQPSPTGTASERNAIQIDPAPSSYSRTASLEEVIGDEDLARRAAEAVVYQVYNEIVERAAILVERSAAARERLWPLVWAVAALVPPPDISSRRPVGAPEASRP